MDDPQTVYFEEKQHFPPWVGVLLFSGVIMAGFGVLATGASGNALMPALLALAVGVAIVSLLFGAMALTTRVTDAGIRVNGLLFINRLISFDEIESGAARKYNPLIEYGGWGYRIGPSGKAYNARGDEGVQLTLRDGGRILIGSGRAQELADAISTRLKR